MKRLILVISAAYLVASSGLAFAQPQEEKSFLSAYFSDAELEVQSATRSPQPVSSVAENITVVTAADIERMNAHTVADVLNTVTGAEVWLLGGPGQMANVSMLGSNVNHVTVIMDGVVLNDLWSGFAEIGMIPVQNIEKIEIIKGPASSAWGSALGGVVNIITKSGRSVDQGSVLSGAYGANGFGDFRAETRGKQDRVGYYLSTGRLQSDGLSPNTSTSENNAYGKFSYELTDKTDVQLSFAYIRTWRDDLLVDTYFSGDRTEQLHSTLAVNSALANNLDLNISVWTINQYMNTSYAADITTDGLSYVKESNQGYGSSAKLTWKGAQQTFVLGTDTSELVDKNGSVRISQSFKPLFLRQLLALQS